MSCSVGTPVGRCPISSRLPGVELGRGCSLRLLIVLLACAGSVAACSAPLSGGAPPDRGAHAARSAAPELARFNQLLVDLVERLRPSLVSVRGGQAIRGAERTGGHHQPRPGTAGFVIDPNGTIVTSAHAVPDRELVEVELSDGRRVRGWVVGKDTRADLALVKVEGAARLATLPLGDSDRLAVGELVLALGHPFGLERAVSLGIVSRKGAPPTGGVPGFDFILTDAAVNPGNSGGPLVNMAGEVVGVNSWAARNGSMGHAIPANLVKLLLPQLAAKGRVAWGWLGVSVAEVRQEDLERLGLRELRGVLVRHVMPGTPADESGVRAQDVIVAIDGRRLDRPRDLQRLMASTPAGTRLRITLVRSGREAEVAVTLGSYDAARQPGVNGELT